ncbi:LapA family protein [Comamonas odontotermitis]|uniref:LapA family protein n=1 Tax=Comamonas odontotermitis TaxID=379895 RepID=UPI001CC382C9|nr:LapA family protein [Comamonas odontotermitis]UBB18098.1 LapA family protein [Comamonas odontotermitis]
MRTILLLIIAVLIGGLAALNWETLSTPSEVNLGLSVIHAPLGVLMLGLTVLLCVLFVAYVLSMQGSVLLEARRHNKEMAAQRELADRAEASRFTELRQVLARQHADGQTALMVRLAELESHLIARAQESDNSNAAYLGQLEDHMRHNDTGSRSLL